MIHTTTRTQSHDVKVGDVYLPAIAGEMPHGEALDAFADAYVGAMVRGGGMDLAMCHASLWAEFSSALTAAAARHAAR